MRITAEDLQDDLDPSELETLESTLTEMVDEALEEHLSDLDLTEYIEGRVEKILTQRIDYLIVQSLGLENGWGNWQVKAHSYLTREIEKRLAPMIDESLTSILGDSLEFDPEWIKAIEEKAEERARDRVEQEVSGRIWSVYGLNREITSSIEEVIHQAAERGAVRVLNDRLTNMKK